MTRCAACNANLSDFESSRKNRHGHYLDLCNHCFGTIADDLTNVKSNEKLMPVVEDNDDSYDIPFNFTDDDFFCEDDSRS